MGKVVTERYFCDICQEEINLNLTKYEPNFYFSDLIVPINYDNSNNKKIVILGNFSIVCKECAKKIADFVDSIKKDAIPIDFNKSE